MMMLFSLINYYLYSCSHGIILLAVLCSLLCRWLCVVVVVVCAMWCVQSVLACFTRGCNFVKLGHRKHKTVMRGQLAITHELHEPLSIICCCLL